MNLSVHINMGTYEVKYIGCCFYGTKGRPSILDLYIAVRKRTVFIWTVNLHVSALKLITHKKIH